MTRDRASAARSGSLPFWGFAAGLAAICSVMARTRIFDRAPDMVAFGTTFDLCLTIPVVYWFFFVRTRKATPATLIPIFGVGFLLARVVVPREHQEFLHSLAKVSSVLELVLCGVLFVRVRRLRRTLRDAANSDTVDRIRIAMTGILGNGRAGELVATEVAILYYAFFSWRRRPRRSENDFTFYRASGWGTILFVLILLIAGEGFAAHVFLARWSAKAAWTFTALDIYSMIWLLGDFQGLRLCPLTFDGRTLRIRLGLRWSADVPAENVASVARLSPGAFPKAKDVLRFSMLEEPRYAIHFREPVPVSGMVGLTRRVRAIGLFPDQPEEFERAFSAYFAD